jgi:hypothetical protein
VIYNDVDEEFGKWDAGELLILAYWTTTQTKTTNQKTPTSIFAFGVSKALNRSEVVTLVSSPFGSFKVPPGN